MGELSQFIDDTIAKGKVALFVKNYCPYCKMAQQILQKETDDVVVVDLVEHAQGTELQNILHQRTGQRTVPSVWINGKFIGGCSEVQALQNIPHNFSERIYYGFLFVFSSSGEHLTFFFTIL